MRQPEEWQEIARAVTDNLPPLTEQQNRGLTAIAVRSARARVSVATEEREAA